MVILSPALLSSANSIKVMVILSPTRKHYKSNGYFVPGSPKLRQDYKSNGYFVPGSELHIKVTMFLSPTLLSSAKIRKAIAVQSAIVVWGRRSGYSSSSSSSGSSSSSSSSNSSSSSSTTTTTTDRKSTRLNSSHGQSSRIPSSA